MTQVNSAGGGELAFAPANASVPLGRRLRHLAASAVWRVRPSLFYYAADKTGRRGVTVRKRGDTIEIARPAEHQMIRIANANALYLPNIAQSFLYFFNSADPVRIRSEGSFYDLVDFSTPRLHQLRGFDDFPVLCPSLTEPFVTTEQYLDFARLSEGQVAFDLGAYSGLTSIAFSKLVGKSGRVIALEPDPLNAATVETNLATHARVNGLDNITLVKAAAAPEPGMLRFSSEGAMGSASVSIIGSHRGQVVEVEAVTLDALVTRLALPQVDFIKIDIEGAELPLILGNGAFLSRYRPRLIIEPHAIDGVLTSGPMIAFLQSLGYSCEVIDHLGLLSMPLIMAHHPG